MRPAMCQVKHDPPHSYGDCLRACIATVMDMPAEQVPHFADAGVDGPAALAHVRQWLAPQGLTVVSFAMPGESSMDELLEWMGEVNPTALYLLFGSVTPASEPAQPGNDHVVVCKGGSVVHNPAWYQSSVKQATSEGIWQIWVVGRV